MTLKINGYEIECPDDCAVTVDGPKIKVERKTETITPIVIREIVREIPSTPALPAWPNTTPLSPTWVSRCDSPNSYIVGVDTQWSFTS